ncbi:MAG: DUF2029 domain-containing protein [Chloracidobacterium sp.]|nr:DUF2029 domain-containing protein [Chloracidobacterium sp.]MDW8218057.1 glycosyltransferase family 87 protein [Acidobacteriota bacterium]
MRTPSPTWSPLVGRAVFWSCAAALCGLGAARSGVTPDVYGNDFTVFYAAARQVILTGNPYDTAIRAATPYLYPPLFAQLLTPLALFPLPVAAGVWAVGNVVAVLWLWRLAQPALTPPHANATRATRAWLWWAALAPVFVGNILLGQVNLWIAVAVTFALSADAERRRSPAAGFALALALSVKVSPVLLLPYFVGRRAWRLLGWCAFWVLLVNSLSLSLLGEHSRDIIQGWYREVIVQGWRFDFAVPSNQSLYGALLRVELWLGIPGRLSYWPLAALGAVWLFSVGWVSRRAIEPAAYPAAATAGAWCVLGAKLSWVVHFALLALPVAVALGGRARRWAAEAGVVGFALCAWSGFQVVPSALRCTVEAWSLFAGAGMAIMLALALALRLDLCRAADEEASSAPALFTACNKGQMGRPGRPR